MRAIPLRAARAIWAVVALLIAITASAALPPRPLVVAYVPNWVDLQKFSTEIDYAKVTHLNLAFENPTNDLGDLSFDASDKFLIDAARVHGVKILISIGGGAASNDPVLKRRYFSLIGEERRAAFVNRLADYLDAHAFDGLDVDLEGPSINADYGAFIHALASVLHARGKLLTAALSQGYGGDHVPAAALGEFDLVNIMAYDGAGYWDPKSPGQHSSLEFARSNVAYWLGRGLPKAKAVLGVPFYGYGFGPAFRKRDYPYKDIVAQYPGAEQRDESGDKIWYNGLPTIRAKAKLARDDGLAGVMIWSLDNDAPGKRSLLRALHETLSAPLVTAKEAKER